MPKVFMCEIRAPRSPGDFNFVEFVGQLHIQGLTFGKDVLAFPPHEWVKVNKVFATRAKEITPILCLDMPDEVADQLRAKYADYRAALIKTPDEIQKTMDQKERRKK